MPRMPLHTDDIKIEQKVPLVGDFDSEREPEIVRAEPESANAYADELSFMDEPVTIRLEPSASENAPPKYPIWVNGKGAEVFINDRWQEVTYLPVGQVLITKRKYVGVLATAKSDSVRTSHDAPGMAEFINNRTDRRTTAVASFSIIEDRNPRGAAWLTELRRRNF